MNVKLVTRLSVFAIAGAVLAGCTTADATRTVEGAGGGAAAGAALGAIFGGGPGAAKGAGAGALIGGAVAAGWEDLKRLFGDDTATATISQQHDGSSMIRLSGNAFAEGSAQLLPEGYKTLTKLATYLTAHRNTGINVLGFTDSNGDADGNRLLSQKRAQAVVNFLTQNDVNSNQVLTVKGYGADNPIATNATFLGRAANRRVEIYLQAIADPAHRCPLCGNGGGGDAAAIE